MDPMDPIMIDIEVVDLTGLYIEEPMEDIQDVVEIEPVQDIQDVVEIQFADIIMMMMDL